MIRKVKCVDCDIFLQGRKIGEKPTKPIYNHITNCMDGVGSQDASILILVDAPDEASDRAGKPLQGSNGELLSALLKKAGIDERDVRITNAVRCRPISYEANPPFWKKTHWSNRTPTFEELMICRKHLVKEIESLPNLKVVIPLGLTALSSILGQESSKIRWEGKKASITSLRGKILEKEGLNAKIIPIFHMSFVQNNPHLEEITIRDLSLASDISKGAILKAEPTDYRIVQTIEDARKLFKILFKTKEFAFDTETTSKDRFYGEKIIDIVFSWREYAAVMLPIWRIPSGWEHSYKANKEDLVNYWVEKYDVNTWNEVLDNLKKLFSDDEIKKIGQNVKYDIKYLNASLNIDGNPLGIITNNIYFDTMIAHFVLNENAPNGLKDMAERYTDLGAYDSDLDVEYDSIKRKCISYNKFIDKVSLICEYYYKTGSINLTGAKQFILKNFGISILKGASPEQIKDAVDVLKKVPLKKLLPHYGMISADILDEYAMKDADCTFRLYKLFKVKIKEQNLDKIFYGIRMPINKPLIEAELDGVNIDLPLIYNIRENLEEKRQTIAQSIYKHVGEEFNIASTLQLRKVLFSSKDEGGLGLTPLAKTKSGEASTDKESLVKLAEETNNPILKEIIEWRHYGVLISTFLTGMEEALDPVTGKVHPNFKITGADTHRIVCSNPNLLNIPRDGPAAGEDANDGSKIRNIFIPDFRTEEKGIEYCSVFIDADLAQAEVRMLASLSDDNSLKELIESGVDLHAFFANRIYHKDNLIEDLKLFKTDPELKNQRSRTKNMLFGTLYGQTPEGAEKKLGIPLEEGKRIINEIFSICPKAREWMDEVYKFATENGYVATPWGVRRRLPVLLQKETNENRNDKCRALRQSVNTIIQTHASDYNCLAYIKVYNELKKENIYFKPKLIIYDAIILECYLKDAKYVANKLHECMTQRVDGVNIRMDAEVEVTNRWSGTPVDIDTSLKKGVLTFLD